MKYIRNNELTLANTVPQLVACRTSDLQLAYKWTHSVHTALAGPTAVGAGRTFVHICRKRTRVTVFEKTWGRERETMWLWGGGDRPSEVVDKQDLYVIVPHCSRLCPWWSLMNQQQIAVSKNQTNKSSHFYMQEIAAYQEINVCFCLCQKKKKKY